MKYIHPSDERIARFAAAVCKENTDLETVCRVLLAWFDANMDYSRLSAPFFPLQRSDIDVLEMRAGACGDRSNLIVSVLLALGFDACYAYVHRDRYGDAQDHICAAAAENGRHILIDATLPYLKWHGYDCGHREYELLSQDEFERRMTEEEAYWSSVAEKQGKPSAAGLLYAPWVHAERVFETEEALGRGVLSAVARRKPRARAVRLLPALYAAGERIADNGKSMLREDAVSLFCASPRGALGRRAMEPRL